MGKYLDRDSRFILLMNGSNGYIDGLKFALEAFRKLNPKTATIIVNDEIQKSEANRNQCISDYQNGELLEYQIQ